jgi:hypothetical protein
MSQIHVVVVSPEEAYDGTAELWCAGELMGITMLSPDGLQLRIDARAMVGRGSSTPPAPRKPSTKRTD